MKARCQLIALSFVLTFGGLYVSGQTANEERGSGKAAPEPIVATIPKPVTLVPAVRPRQAATLALRVVPPLQPKTAAESLRSAKRIFVYSTSLLVGQSVIESKLRNRPEFQTLGLMITRDANDADLILEVHHDLFTKYVFTAVDPSTNVVVASGKLSSLGGTVAGKVAKRFMKQLVKARTGP